MSTDGLDGKVALVGGGDEPLGRSVALALAARGVRVVVTGGSERALGETVGEVVYGGGKARHVVGTADAVARAVDVFGGLDVVVSAASDGDVLGAAAPRLREGGAVVAVGGAPPQCGRGVTRVAVVVEGDGELDPDGIAQLVVFLCSRAGRGLDGRTVAVR